LRKAVDGNELSLVYQPKVAFAGGSAHYVEALLRWHHPKRGVVSPIDFIPFAEQTGYIRSITQWVLTHAIAQCAMWHGEGMSIHVSINLSARDVMDDTLPDRVAGLLQVHGCAAQWISLEITESAILDDPGHAVENLKRLSALGCKLSIDDYGTGYSSLAYLRNFPFDKIKIDRSFVRDMLVRKDCQAIVRAVVGLARSLGITTIIEGIETKEQLAGAKADGCDEGQGYLFAKPMPEPKVAAFLAECERVAAAA
jgi:EAL domain-containing protein (putative c-di-GMP-specific phosphodiesterase class I)